MKALIRFSLNRRLNNPVSMMLYAFSFALIAILLFADVILNSFAPALVNPRAIYMNTEMFAVLGDHLPTHLVYQKDKKLADITIEVRTDGYVVEGILDYNEKQIIDQLIHGYHRIIQMERLPDYLISVVDQVLIADIAWQDLEESKTNHLGFVVITSIYFMLLSFSTAVANEVVNEKTSNVIEVILTSVSHKHHYYSKLLIGWLTMVTQLFIHGFGFVFWLMVRTVYDQGFGLLEMVYRWGWLQERVLSFGSLLSSLNVTISQGINVLLCATFLMLGILLVQLLMVLLSIHINSIEEAAAIQGPFYLGMLVIYYMAIFINSSQQLNQGIGYALSFVPVFSMLFMPSRLLSVNVLTSELLLSLFIALVMLIFCVVIGQEHYKRNLLKGSSKSSYVKK